VCPRLWFPTANLAIAQVMYIILGFMFYRLILFSYSRSPIALVPNSVISFYTGSQRLFGKISGFPNHPLLSLPTCSRANPSSPTNTGLDVVREEDTSRCLMAIG
jgi:hypothetical protein